MAPVLTKPVRITGSYQCEACSTHFASVNSFQLHRISVHSNSFQVRCSLRETTCEITYAEPTPIRFPHKREEKWDGYECGVCRQNFSVLDVLLDHLQKRHKHPIFSQRGTSAAETKIEVELKNEQLEFKTNGSGPNRMETQKPAKNTSNKSKAHVYQAEKGKTKISQIQKASILKKVAEAKINNDSVLKKKDDKSQPSILKIKVSKAALSSSKRAKVIKTKSVAYLNKKKVTLNGGLSKSKRPVTSKIRAAKSKNKAVLDDDLSDDTSTKGSTNGSDQLDSELGVTKNSSSEDSDNNSESLQCSYCLDEFLTSMELKLHVIANHETEFKSTCPICSKNMSSEKHYKYHLGTHYRNTGQWKCKMCFRRYHLQSSLHRHVKQNHENKSTET